VAVVFNATPARQPKASRQHCSERDHQKISSLFGWLGWIMDYLLLAGLVGLV